jgi:two-component system, NtrC family, response regulator AlgB
MHILIVDDEPNIRSSLRIALESMKHKVDEADGISAALDQLARSEFDLALVDVRLGKDSGFNLLDTIGTRSPRLPVVIVTAHSSIETAVDAMRRGAFDYLPKPFTPAQIRAVLERFDRVRSLRNEVTGLRDQIARDVPEVSFDAQDPKLQLVLEQGRQVAATDAVVLIRGESGTGKGVFARALHGFSRRASAPFVTISCPSLNADLLESALFGHARGSFTGAVTDTEGKVAVAEGGSLLLDEIGDLPLLLQPKLLRFLQERRYERVGETRTRTADVRLIAASNRDLEAAVAAGAFREDLLFRLNVVELTLPPLRERSGRLELAEHLLSFFSRQIGKKLEGFSAETRETLLQYAWPGNLREMRNAIERAVIFAKGPSVTLADLPERIAKNIDRSAPQGAPSIQVGRPFSLEQIETEHIRLIVEQSPTLDDAARVLGIDPSTLYRKRKQLGL